MNWVKLSMCVVIAALTITMLLGIIDLFKAPPLIVLVPFLTYILYKLFTQYELVASLERGSIRIPEGLNPETKSGLIRFFNRMAYKARLSEIKYGYTNDWKSEDWEAECREHLYEHVEKGDPRDVAMYCMFMDFHGWTTYAKP